MTELGVTAYRIIAIGIYFNLQAQSIVFYGIGIQMPIVLLFSFGLTTVIFLTLVLIFTYVFEWGFLGICWATTLNFILRFVLGYGYLTYKETEPLMAARSVPLFHRQTLENLGYQV